MKILLIDNYDSFTYNLYHYIAKFKKNVLVNRSKAIKILKEKIKKKTYLISTTGYTSRELFEINNISFNKKIKTFYNVGGMGHASSIALGVSLNKKNEVICLDGDGSILMHLGSVNTIGKYAKENFKDLCKIKVKKIL